MPVQYFLVLGWVMFQMIPRTFGGLQKRNKKLGLHKKRSCTCICLLNNILGILFPPQHPFGCSFFFYFFFLSSILFAVLSSSMYKNLFQPCNKSLINLSCSVPAEYWPSVFSVLTSLCMVCTVKTLGQYFPSMAFTFN